jgi:carnitine 3-dehydrogenase
MVDGCAEMAGDQHFEQMAEDRDKKIVAVLNAIKSN